MRGRLGKLVVAVTICVLLSAPAIGEVSSPDEVLVRVGTIRALGTCTPLIAQRMGFLEGQGIDIRIAVFPDGPTMMQAFAAGQIDVAYGGLVPAAIWFMNGIDLKIIGSANAGGHTVLVRSGSGIVDLTDLASKKVATPSVGSVTDTLFRAWVLETVAGMNPISDLTLIPGVAPSDMPSMLCITKEVDAVVTWEPFVSQALHSYEGVEVLFDYAAHWRTLNGGRNYPVNVVSVRDGFRRDFRDALGRYMDVHRRTVRFIAEEPREAHEVIAEEFHLPVSIVRDSLTRMDFTLDLDEAACMTVLGFARELGYMRDLPDPAVLFELGVY